MPCSKVQFKEENREKSAIRVSEKAEGYQINVCNQCGECVEVCPTLALHKNKLGVIMVDKEKCVGCFACIGFCPTLSMRMHDLDDKQNRMRKTGTAYLTEIMNDYDLLPTNNFKFGSHPDAHKLSSKEFSKWFQLSGSDGCWFGCTLACCKVVPDFELLTGPYKGQKVVVDGPEYETVAAVGSSCGIFDSQYVLESNFYCDTYGVDTISLGNITGFCMECYEEGIINKEITGGLELNFGNKEAALELLHQMARGEGFGKVAGLGVRKLKEIFVKEYGADPEFLDDIGMENKGLEYSMVAGG